MCKLCETQPDEIFRKPVLTPQGYNAILIQDSDAYYVEAIDYDYLAAGDTEERAINNFDYGLTSTLYGEDKKSIGLYGDIQGPGTDPDTI